MKMSEGHTNSNRLRSLTGLSQSAILQSSRRQSLSPPSPSAGPKTRQTIIVTQNQHDQQVNSASKSKNNEKDGLQSSIYNHTDNLGAPLPKKVEEYLEQITDWLTKHNIVDISPNNTISPSLSTSEFLRQGLNCHLQERLNGDWRRLARSYWKVADWMVEELSSIKSIPIRVVIHQWIANGPSDNHDENKLEGLQNILQDMENTIQVIVDGGRNVPPALVRIQTSLQAVIQQSSRVHPKAKTMPIARGWKQQLIGDAFADNEMRQAWNVVKDLYESHLKDIEEKRVQSHTANSTIAISTPSSHLSISNSQKSNEKDRNITEESFPLSQSPTTRASLGRLSSISSIGSSSQHSQNHLTISNCSSSSITHPVRRNGCGDDSGEDESIPHSQVEAAWKEIPYDEDGNMDFMVEGVSNLPSTTTIINRKRSRRGEDESDIESDVTDDKEARETQEIERNSNKSKPNCLVHYFKPTYDLILEELNCLHDLDSSRSDSLTSNVALHQNLSELHSQLMVIESVVNKLHATRKIH